MGVYVPTYIHTYISGSYYQEVYLCLHSVPLHGSPRREGGREGGGGGIELRKDPASLHGSPNQMSASPICKTEWLITHYSALLR